MLFWICFCYCFGFSTASCLVSNQTLIMEELFGRFPHLSENIFFKLNCQSLMTCREVSRTWNNTIEAESLSYLKVIKSYTQCSDELLNKILDKCGAPIILVSILKEIFSKFPKGTKQSNITLDALWWESTRSEGGIKSSSPGWLRVHFLPLNCSQLLLHYHWDCVTKSALMSAALETLAD